MLHFKIFLKIENYDTVDNILAFDKEYKRK